MANSGFSLSPGRMIELTISTDHVEVTHVGCVPDKPPLTTIGDGWDVFGGEVPRLTRSFSCFGHNVNSYIAPTICRKIMHRRLGLQHEARCAILKLVLRT